MAGIDDKKYHIKCKFIHSATLEMVKSIHVIADPFTAVIGRKRRNTGCQTV